MKGFRLERKGGMKIRISDRIKLGKVKMREHE